MFYVIKILRDGEWVEFDGSESIDRMIRRVEVAKQVSEGPVRLYLDEEHYAEYAKN